MKFLARTAFALIIALSPVVANTAEAQFFGPLIPEECHCDDQVVVGDEGTKVDTAPDFGCVMQTIQNGFNLAISLIGIIFVIAIVIAGAQLVVSGGNPQKIQWAKDRIFSLIVGLVVFMCAWLLVDFVMKTLYDENAKLDGSSKFGPWNSILSSGGTAGRCIVATTPTSIISGSLDIVGGAPGTTDPGTGGGGGGGGGANCPVPNESTMVALPAAAVNGGGTIKATPTTVTNFLEMRAAAAKEGITLKVNSGYRSDAKQVQLWNQICGSGRCTGSVAKPCSMGGSGSNHNSGLALDIQVGCSNGQSGCNTKTYQWLKANGSKWGFRNALPTDPVHWSPSGR